MKLSKNFSLKELTRSQTADRKGIMNNPNEEQIDKLQTLCEFILQPVRDHFKQVVSVSSGYRSEELCVAIGSSINSQHAKGEAADFEITGLDNFELAEWIRDQIPEFDQLILEFYTDGDENSGWIHCSYSRENNRKSILTATKESGKTEYHQGLVK